MSVYIINKEMFLWQSYQNFLTEKSNETQEEKTIDEESDKNTDSLNSSDDNNILMV